jgi:dihydroorotase
MANTSPPIDSAAVLGSVRDRAEREASVPVGFIATVTREMAGEELTEMAELRDAGAIGFSDDGLPIANARVLRRALQYQRLAGGVIALHEEDPDLSGEGVMHEGEVSASLGMASICRPAPPSRRSRTRRRPGCRSRARPPRTTSHSPTRRSGASTPGSR